MTKYLELFDKVKVIRTDEIGYIVDIGKTGRIVVEKEADEPDDKLIYDLLEEDLEKIEE